MGGGRENRKWSRIRIRSRNRSLHLAAELVYLPPPLLRQQCASRVCSGGVDVEKLRSGLLSLRSWLPLTQDGAQAGGHHALGRVCNNGIKHIRSIYFRS